MTDFLEQFALADNRDEKIATLLAGTEPFYHYSVLHLLNAGKDGSHFSKVKSLLSDWEDKLGRSDKWNEMSRRYELMSYNEKKPDATVEWFKNNLGVSYGHYQQSIDSLGPSATQYDTHLDGKQIGWEKMAKDEYYYHNFTTNNWLVQDRLWKDRAEWRESLSSDMHIPDAEDLVKQTASWLNKSEYLSFGSHTIHTRMTLKQLDELRSAKSSIINDSKYVDAYLIRLLPNADVDLKTNPTELEAYYNRLSKFIAKLSPAYNNYRFTLLFNQLRTNLHNNKIDEDLFLEYVKLPKSSSIANPKMYEKLDYSYIVRTSGTVILELDVPSFADDEKLVRDYLTHIFKNPKAVAKEWYTYFYDYFIDRLFAETKLLYTDQDQETYTAQLTIGLAQELKDRVEINLLPSNPTYYKPSADVAIDVEIKNVPTMIVKVFEINTRRYYRDNSAEVPTDIQLDGLVPNYEEVFKYEQHPQLKRHVERFTFASMTSRRGLFVIEFIGNGVSSRCIIRKGKLSFVDRVGVAGHVFTILDEEGAKLKNVSLWLNGHEFNADKHGRINVPFTKNAGLETLLITNNDDSFTSLDHFQHVAEEYTFNGQFYVDRESLLSLGKSTVLVRAALNVSGVSAPLALLTDVIFTIATRDIDDAESSKEVHDFKLEDNAESTFEFQVPANLRSVTFSLRAKVKSVSTGSTETVAASKTFGVNQIETESEFRSFFLRRSPAPRGYDLLMLGKTGEPIKDKAFNICIKPKFLTSTKSFTLQTDKAGVCNLGELKEIEYIELNDPRHCKYRLESDSHSMPTQLHALEGEEIQVPFMNFGGATVDRSHAALFELRLSTHPYQDHFDKISLKDGLLRLNGLSAGRYQLFIKESNHVINIRVTKGKAHSDYLFGSKVMLQQSDLTPLQIAAVDVKKDKISISLENSTDQARVHVYATEFAPDFSIVGFVDQSLPSPTEIDFSTAKSEYLSGRTLGEEYRYVLERKYAEKHPGNTLTRPSLLLQPWAIQSTSTTKKEAADGTAFKNVASAYARSALGGGGRSRGGSGQLESYASYDFKKQSSTVLLNLRPNKDGIVTIETSKIFPNGLLRIVALDGMSSAFREVPTELGKLSFKDLRLQAHRALDANLHFTEQKNITEVQPKDVFLVEDITTSKIEIFDTLTKVAALFSTIKKNDTFQEFNFALSWTKLSAAEKSEKYSKYACHELNYFIFRKDPEWFEAAVKPYLKNKKEQTFVDHWLLENDVSAWLAPGRFIQLNTFEQALLIERVSADQQDNLRRYFADKADQLPVNTPLFNSLFQMAIKGSDLDTSDEFNLNAARDEQLEKMVMEDAYEDTYASSSLNAAPPMASRSLMSADLDMPMEKEMANEADDHKEDKRRRMKKEEAPEKRKKKSASKSDKLDLAARNVQRQFFQQVDQTQEYAETNYWKVLNTNNPTQLVPFSTFWSDFANRHPKKPFISKNFIYATSSFTEMFLALAVIDLPAQSASDSHKFDYKDSSLKITTGKTSMIIFHKDIKESSVEQKPILVSQTFFDPDDRYSYDKGEHVEKYIEEEFLRHKIYGCNVVITNVSSSRQRSDALVQIPIGAIPVNKTATTKSNFVDLYSYTTTRQEFYFYFPAAGKFEMFPVNVARDEKVIAYGQPIVLNVVNQFTKHDTKSWEWISQMAPDNELLTFLDKENIFAVDIDKIAWRMTAKPFFEKSVAILARRHRFSPTLWSYGLYHHNVTYTIQYLDTHSQRLYNLVGPYVQSPLTSTDPVALRKVEHLEYWPIVNARAHQLGSARTILNDKFKVQYERFLNMLCYKKDLSAEDWMAATYYMLLQDRIDDAKKFFNKIADAAKRDHYSAGSSSARKGKSKDKKDKDKKSSKKGEEPHDVETSSYIRCKLQYDYLAAYMDFFNDAPSVSRNIVEAYSDYPVQRWQRLFAQVKSQLKELDEGKAADVVDEDQRDQRQGALAATEPSLDFSVNSDNTITLNYQAMQSCRVRYYKMDIELLFSNSPFVQKNLGNFAYIMPNAQSDVALPADQSVHTFAIPKEFQNENIMIDISSGPIASVKPHFSHNLFVNLVENYGQVKVYDKESNKPISKAYVKVYARHRGGRVSFYKDGYTDLRGGFDYVALNTNDLETTERFSILVTTEKNGTRIVEASPPKK